MPPSKSAPLSNTGGACQLSCVSKSQQVPGETALPDRSKRKVDL